MSVYIAFWGKLRLDSCADVPTLDDHPGQALYDEYCGYTDVSRRDRWYKTLDEWQRDQLIHYRMLLRCERCGDGQKSLCGKNLTAINGAN